MYIHGYRMHLGQADYRSKQVQTQFKFFDIQWGLIFDLDREIHESNGYLKNLINGIESIIARKPPTGQIDSLIQFWPVRFAIAYWDE